MTDPLGAAGFGTTSTDSTPAQTTSGGRSGVTVAPLGVGARQPALGWRLLGRTLRVLRSVGRALRDAADWLGRAVAPAGWLLLGLAVLGLTLGLAFGLVEALVAAVFAAVILAACLPFLLGGSNFELRLTIDRDRVVAGNELSAALQVTNRARRFSLPSVIDIPVGAGMVAVRVPLLRAGASSAERLQVEAKQRGIIDIGPMTIARGDPMGVLRREVSWDETRRIYVHPVTVALPATSAGMVRDLDGLASDVLVDADLSFHAVRQYRPGDQQRHVHWKATAKTGTLMVRQYEESRHSRVAVLLDVREEAYESDDGFELAVSAAGSLALQGIYSGRQVLAATGNREGQYEVGPANTMRMLPTLAPRELLDALSGINLASSAIRIESLARLARQAFDDLSIVFVVTGAELPFMAFSRIQNTFGANVEVVIVRAYPDEQPAVARAQSLRILTIGALADLKGLLARGALR